MPIVQIYIIAAALVASLGRSRKRKNAFWWFFVISLIFTPFVGLIVIMATDPVDKKQEHEQDRDDD